MKKFILKAALYFTVVLIIIIAIIFFARSKSPDPFLFVSNSPSYNFKAGFIKKHLDRLKSSKIVVFGSSMSLNNVNSVMLQDSFHSPTINLASWGLKLSNYKDADLWGEDKILISNIQFSDFGESAVTLKNGLNFDINRATEIYNIFKDFKTYLDLQKFAKVIAYKNTDRNYDYCGFDQCGSVLLSDSNFQVLPKRWNMDEYKAQKVDSTSVKFFVDELKEAIETHKKGAKIIITFSPARRIFYREERSKMVVKLAHLLKTECPNVVFINKYDDNYPDKLYVDNCHFNRSGANKYTSELIDSIRKKKAIN